MIPPMPPNRNVAPIRSGATSWTLRSKELLRRRGLGMAGRVHYHVMRIFLAGAAGVIGRRLTPLLVLMGHAVTGTTRSAAKTGQIEASCGRPVVVDVFDAAALTRVMLEA